MKLLYLSTHSVLEQDELSLFTEMGIECFSCGAYADPKGHKSLPRPEVRGMKPHPDLEEIARHFPKTNLPQQLIDWADVIMIMHTPEWVTENWDRIKYKQVVWRSIGQSVPSIENTIRRMRYDGLKIVRYSPMEKNVPGYVGEDTIIRFYKDPSEWCEWNGKVKRVINFTQTLKGRRDFCHYDHLMEIIDGFPAIVFGSGNDDLGPLNGGDLPYEDMKGQLRENRVFVYSGTWPAAYTLAFIEAWMTGIPVVSIGTQLAENINSVPPSARFPFFEIPALVTPGENGFVSDNIGQLKTWVHQLFEDRQLAEKVGAAGRKKAIETFGKGSIQPLWEKFFKEL